MGHVQGEGPTLDHVADHIDVACHGAPHTAGKPYHCALPVTQRADAMQRALYPGAVVATKLPNSRFRGLEIIPSDLQLTNRQRCEPSLGEMESSSGKYFNLL